MPLLPSRKASPPFGWYSLRLPTKGWPGWVDLGGWSHTEINVPHRELNPDTVTHLSTNRAQRWLTSLIETNALTTTYARPPTESEAWLWRITILSSPSSSSWSLLSFTHLSNLHTLFVFSLELFTVLCVSISTTAAYIFCLLLASQRNINSDINLFSFLSLFDVDTRSQFCSVCAFSSLNVSVFMCVCVCLCEGVSVSVRMPVCVCLSL